MNAAAVNPEPAFGVLRDRFGQGLALFLEDSRCKRFGSVALLHRHGPLEDDRAIVVVVVDEMNGAPADRYA